ncbi:hypothetical protein WA577_006876, partial [Blastocystis sp. JDR]
LIGDDTFRFCSHVVLENLPELYSLRLGRNCFKNTVELNLIGLNELEKVVIGEDCFNHNANDPGYVYCPDSHFRLKNCMRLRELRIGSGSFSDYRVCEIENVDH